MGNWRVVDGLLSSDWRITRPISLDNLDRTVTKTVAEALEQSNKAAT